MTKSKSESGAGTSQQMWHDAFALEIHLERYTHTVLVWCVCVSFNYTMNGVYDVWHISSFSICAIED